MAVVTAKPEHEVAYQDLQKLIGKHADKMSAFELLAIAANVVGKLIALQDQRAVTAEQCMELVAVNIEYGNQQVLEKLQKSKGSA